MNRSDELEVAIVNKFSAIASAFDERARRLWAAAESRAIGYGGDALVDLLQILGESLTLAAQVSDPPSGPFD